ncbi:major facilitator superfamily domain-containing protein [Lasiosphaeria miniovina]|uniref:Major facilitator superfamily domain-containing protein n=1 Tax=Lasiosphaeria miniovina TaxID=1954250 RepID=A0AA40DLC3_9PEZI|nr:major facilitator superfamily domain-containing protein [Lasiosphaeria miniovina]KAK0704073.1 major facilitator superfamily domain-containing protein [Lasiosphaeria miniovina]
MDKSENSGGSPRPGDVKTLDLERLGQHRQPAFPNLMCEIMFCSSLLISMLMAEYFISGFNIVLPEIVTALSIPKGSQTWPASVFSLVTGSFLLPFGRLADIYGAYIVFTLGMAWFCLWCLITGFSHTYTMLIVARALGGLGPAAFLPASVMLISKTYCPGPRKNLVFGLYSAFAPIGFFLGIITGGLTGQFLSWRWYFWLGSIVLFLASLISFIAVPNDRAELQLENENVKMDYWGVAMIVPALVLLTFAITDGSHAPNGWATPYIIVIFVLGILFLGGAVYVEGWVASQPLLPFDLFKPKYMKRLAVSLFFAYGVFGIYLFYASLHIANVMGASELVTAVWFAPMAAGGIILATIGGFTLHLLPGRILLIISGVGSVASVLLFALIPEGANYWAFVFPAMVGATVGVDITFLVSNIFITANVPRHRQGLAGALIYSVLFLGISFFLGLADLAVSESEKRSIKDSPRIAFMFAIACAVVALLIFSTIRIPKAEADSTPEECLTKPGDDN